MRSLHSAKFGMHLHPGSKSQFDLDTPDNPKVKVKLGWL